MSAGSTVTEIVTVARCTVPPESVVSVGTLGPETSETVCVHAAPQSAVTPSVVRQDLLHRAANGCMIEDSTASCISDSRALQDCMET
jgi:hypothetical protein